MFYISCFTFHVLHFKFYISCFSFHVEHFMFYITCFTFHLSHSMLYIRSSTFYVVKRILLTCNYFHFIAALVRIFQINSNHLCSRYCTTMYITSLYVLSTAVSLQTCYRILILAALSKQAASSRPLIRPFTSTHLEHPR